MGNVYLDGEIVLNSADSATTLTLGGDSAWTQVNYGNDTDVVHNFRGTMISGSATSTGSFAKLSLGGSTPHEYYQLTIKDGSTAGLVLHDTGQSPYQIAANGSVLYLRYNSDNAKSIFLKNDGNVGIGVTTPGDKLTVQGGNIQISGSGGIGIKFVGTSDGSNKNALYFRTQGGTEKYRMIHDAAANGTDDIVFKAAANSITTLALKQDGKVGIGTASPGTNLEVYGGDSSAGIVRITGGEANNAVLQLYADQGDNTSDKWQLISQASDNDFLIKSNTTEVLRITDGSGNLQVLGAGVFGGDITLPDAGNINTGTTDGSDNKELYIAGGGDVGVTRGAYIQLSGNEDANTGRLLLRGGGVSGATIDLVLKILVHLK